MLVDVISYSVCSMLRVSPCAVRVACKNVVTATVTELHCFSFPQDTLVKPTVKFSNNPLRHHRSCGNTNNSTNMRQKTEKAAV